MMYSQDKSCAFVQMGAEAAEVYDVFYFCLADGLCIIVGDELTIFDGVGAVEPVVGRCHAVYDVCAGECSGQECGVFEGADGGGGAERFDLFLFIRFAADDSDMVAFLCEYAGQRLADIAQGAC